MIGTACADLDTGAYRRGYCDGWLAAVEAMGELMLYGHLSRQAAYDACVQHRWQALSRWRAGVGGRVPPRVERARL